MKLRQIIGTLGFAALLGVSCDYKNPCNEIIAKDYVTGTVEKESDRVIGFVVSSETNFNKEPVKIVKQEYVLSVKTPQGKYTINIEDLYCRNGPKTIQGLAARIEKGTKVKFPTKFENCNSNEDGLCFLIRDESGNNYTGFSKDKIGTLDPNDIEIIQ